MCAEMIDELIDLSIKQQLLNNHFNHHYLRYIRWFYVLKCKDLSVLCHYKLSMFGF